jgi:hypothetical protein
MRLRICLLVAALAAIPSSSSAAIYNIASGDVGSLIFAIRVSDLTAGDDVINLAAGGSYELTMPYSVAPSTGPDGLPPITGAQPGRLTINGNNASIFRSGAVLTVPFRIFHIGSAGRLVLRNVRLTNGTPGAFPGGAILNLGQLELRDSFVAGNAANIGGGLANYGTATLANTTLWMNEASLHGGGVSNVGRLQLTSSTVWQNDATQRGGGIYSAAAVTTPSTTRTPDLAIESSTIGRNTARDGGGIWSENDSDVTLSLVRDNTAQVGGGGIFMNRRSLYLRDTMVSTNTASGGYGGGVHSRGEARIWTSTLNGNVARDGGGGAYHRPSRPEDFWESRLILVNATVSGNRVSTTEGGGVLVRSSRLLHLSASNTTITLNSAGGGFAGVGGVLVYGTVAEMGNIIISGNAGANFVSDTFAVVRGLVGGDARLGPLANNGGPTLTHSPLQGSSALAGGDADYALDLGDRADDGLFGGDPLTWIPLVTDQRGRPRFHFQVDLGSVELQ